MNNVHILYQQPSLSPNIRITLVRFELWKTQPVLSRYQQQQHQ